VPPPCKPLLTIAEAAEFAQMSQRELRRVLKDLMKQEGNDNLLMKAPGQRIYRIRREDLRKALGMTDQDFKDTVDRHGRLLDDHDRRIRRLEHDKLQHSKTG
jgi:hypothetical protein